MTKNRIVQTQILITNAHAVNENIQNNTYNLMAYALLTKHKTKSLSILVRLRQGVKRVCSEHLCVFAL